MAFDYHEAFSRNLGWLTAADQEILRAKRIALAGMGGVGGSHLLTLTRLGVGAFHLSDFDQFELPNFNRQVGASVSTLERDKLTVMCEMALDINPELEINLFPEGISSDNLDAFLDGVDLYLDSLDFFALDIRQQLFAACRERGVPALTAAPLGMGTALLYFAPDGMSFEQYFRLEGQSEEEQALRFMLGLAPAPQQLAYLVDDSVVDFQSKKGPSTPMACDLCAGAAATWVLKLLLHRGKVPAAPRGVHFDAYRNRVVKTWRPGGNANPLQRAGLAIARKRVMAQPEANPDSTAIAASAMERILEAARWAPSGDNEQPWRFEQHNEHRATIHARDTRDWCVYDLDGSSSQIAVGALLETLAIAATGEGRRAQFALRPDCPDTAPIIDVELVQDDAAVAHPCLPFVAERVTQRRPFSTRPLSDSHKQALEAALGDQYRVCWLEAPEQRRRVAKLLFHNAHIRLATPEAYVVHKKNIEWGAQFSEDRLPEHALGIDWPTRKIMRWALGSWRRVQFLNRFLAGTWLPRLQMDLRTGLGCAAHFVIVSHRPLSGIEDYLAGGRAMQRFWLEATRQGLQFQPEMTPLIFSRYVTNEVAFTRVAKEQALAERLAGELCGLLGPDAPCANRVFMGRVGFGQRPTSRSIRQPLVKLLVPTGAR